MARKERAPWGRLALGEKPTYYTFLHDMVVLVETYGGWKGGYSLMHPLQEQVRHFQKNWKKKLEM